MKINKIYAVNFRNYGACNLDFSSMINVFYGQNAQGKTNILEAIFYSAFGMSHRTFTEEDLLKLGCKEMAVGVEYDSFSGVPEINIKIGDGVTEWNNLNYALNVADILAQIPDVDLTSVTNNVQIRDTYDELANGKVVGDIAIVKAPLFEGATSQFTHTAYVWNGEAWAAMDGNYSAANVLLGSDITLAGSFSSVGNYSKGKTYPVEFEYEKADWMELITDSVCSTTSYVLSISLLVGKKDNKILLILNSS